MTNRNYPPEEAAYWAARQAELSNVSRAKEIDVGQALQQRALSQHVQQQPSASLVRLKAGSPYYKIAEGGSGFGFTAPIALYADKVRPEQSNMEFTIEKQVSCFIVENHDYTKAIDTTNLPRTNLVAVQTPFTGTVLVHESAIVYTSVHGNGANNLLKG